MTVAFETLLRLLLSPLLVLNVAWVLARAKRFPEAAGPRSGSLGHGPPLRVLIVGDSSSVGVGVATQSQALAGHVARAFADTCPVSWRVLGKNGITTRGLSLWLERHDSDPPYDLVVIALGVNDVKNGVPLRQWRRHYHRLLVQLTERFGARSIIASGLPHIRSFTLLPQPLRWILGRRAEAFDAALQEITTTHSNTKHVSINLPLRSKDMADDGFHPGPPIYAAWAERIKSAYETQD